MNRNPEEITSDADNSVLALQRKCAAFLAQHMSAGALVPLALNYSLSQLEHVMEPTKQRLLSSFFSMMNYSVRQLILYNNNNTDFALSVNQLHWTLTFQF